MTQTMPQPPLQSSGQVLTKGSTEPRIFTKPLRKLTPSTSYGFAVAEFARHVLKEPLTPWQEWVVIHLGELLEDGRPRFRKALVLVARQNGKTHLLKVLAAFWLMVQRVEQVLGLSTNRESAKEAWDKARKLIESNPLLAEYLTKVKTGNNDTYLETVEGSVYRIRAANDGAARGLTVDRIIFDELRQQKTFDAWDAVMPTMAARPYAQAICISNAGDDSSAVLNKLQAEAVEFITSGTGDYRLGIFEWSAAPGDDITDPQTWAKANPNMGYIFSEDELRGDAISAVNQGGEVLAGFKTERLCMRVSAMDAAIDADRWADCLDETVSLANVPKSQIRYCLDRSLNGAHATLMAAAVVGDRVRIEVVKEWQTANAVQFLVPDIEALARKHRIKTLGYFPIGPAAAIAAELKSLKVPGLAITEITGEVSESCEGLADHVRSRRISHDGDPMVTAQITAVAKKWTADRWKFSRNGQGNCDAAYAAAGAWQLAITAPPPKTMRLIGPDDEDEG